MKKLFWAVPTLCFAFLTLSTNGLAQGRLPLRSRHPRLGPPPATAPDSGATSAASASYSFTFISSPGELNTDLEGINKGATASQLTVAGGYETSTGSGIWSGQILDFSSTDGVSTETFSPLNYPGSINGEPADINNEGQVVGSYNDSAGYHGYELTNGKFTAINVPFPGAVYTAMSAINDEGNMVGCWGTSTVGSGFELIGGTYTNIQVPGASNTCSTGIDNNNDVVGYYWIGSDFQNPYGFELSGGVYTTIQVPGSTATEASGINNSGQIAGFYCATTQCADTFYSGVKGFILSGGVYSTVAIPQTTDTFVYDISDAGVISGIYFNASAETAIQHGFIGVPK